ncbi:MAG: 30S ribosomal protein S5 [Candidatus Moranbacteria bacterium]|nr:30S ribosomal protein S5 [Candidatus Moranbacteria bacterium]
MQGKTQRKSSKDRRGRREKPEYDQKLLDLARVTRVVKGGRRFRFRATVVIGNRKGRVGVGVSKGNDVSDAISKAYNDAMRHLVDVVMSDSTIPHSVYIKKGSAKILLKPATAGRGVIAGGAVRSVVDLAGIHDIVSKSLGTSNKLNVARATIDALKQLRREKRL